MIIAILNALAAIPSLTKSLEYFCSIVSAWWLANQQEQNYQAIIDAAALSARASSQEDRINALKNWQTVLSRPRFVK